MEEQTYQVESEYGHQPMSGIEARVLAETPSDSQGINLYLPSERYT